MAYIFDTHAHYDDRAFDRDREEVLSSLSAAGIGHVTNIACDLQSIRTTLDLAHRYSWMYAAVGVHPEYAEMLTEENFHIVRDALRDEKTAAIGEIGLDYYWKNNPEHPTQRYWFARQLDLAYETGFPVVIHSRDAARDTADILKAHHGPDIGGVIHCFGYSKEMAREFLNMGFYIGIGGVVTYKNARKLKEVAEYAPLDRILLETDCPYMAPEPRRSDRNDSSRLPSVAKMIAEIRGISIEEVIRVTEDNAFRMYRIRREE